MKKIMTALLLLVLTACGDDSNGLTAGTVINRKYTPESSSIHSHPITSQQCRTVTTRDAKGRSSSSTQCRTVTTGYFPHTHRTPPNWRIQIEQDRPCPVDKKGQEKCKTGWIDVTREDFDRYPPGSHWPDAR